MSENGDEQKQAEAPRDVPARAPVAASRPGAPQTEDQPPKHVNPWRAPRPGKVPSPAPVPTLSAARLSAVTLWQQIFHLPPRANGASWWPILLTGAAGLWWATSCLHPLHSGEQGIVTRLGAYARLVGPGLAVTLPWPIEDLQVSDVGTIRSDAFPEQGEQVMLTGDQGLVDMRYTVRWRIKDTLQFAFQIDDPHRALRQAAQAAMRTSLADVTLADVMGGQALPQIAARGALAMQQTLDGDHAGVVVLGVDIERASTPARLDDGARKIVTAQADAARDMASAQSYAQQTIARAQGEAAAFDKVYAAYKQAPEVTRRRMYYDTMEHVLMANDTIVVPSGTNVLPIPEPRKKPEATQPGGNGP